MPITIRKIELFCSLLFFSPTSLQCAKMPVFLSFFPKNRHFETGSNCDVPTLKRTSFSTFFVVGRSNHLPTTSAFFRQIPSVSIYTKKLEINLAAMPRGFESHRLRQEAVAQGKNPSAAASLRLNASRSTKTLAIDPLISKKQITQTGPSE